jgi:beta-glucosidase
MKILIRSFAVVSLIFLVSCNKNQHYEFPFQDPNLSVEERVDDLITRLTLEEKASQLVYDAPGIKRLGIPAYNWWNECLHGVARNGLATVFPQAIGMAATFDTSAMRKMGEVIAVEARAKYNKAISNDEHGIYQGLTFWTPNINIFRDPRWGRGMETYGEDPYLTGSLAVPFIKALQGNNPKYFKTIATSKHFVVHSGPEPLRHQFNAEISQRDFLETYSPHFKRTIQEANVQSVMCAYNRLDGEPCCGSNKLLNDLLRNEWGFKGYVVSDCWALMDFFNGHHVSKTLPEASALGLLGGTDLNCGVVFKNLEKALEGNLIKEEDIDKALKRLLTARFKLGMFDPKEMVPFSEISYDKVDCDQHKKIALESALKSMVLLKNENKTLPLKKTIKRIAVVGPNANNLDVLLGNYNGYPSSPVTPLQGIKDKVGPNTEIVYARGCNHANGMSYFTTIPGDVFYIDSLKQKHGLTVEYFNNFNQQGKALKQETTPNIDVNWWDKAPLPEMKTDSFSVRWSGYLVPEISGNYVLRGQGQTGFQIIFNHTDTISGTNIHADGTGQKQFYLEKGKSYPVQVNFYNLARMADMKLVWDYPVKDLEKEAISAASNSDLVIMFMGLSPQLEGEELQVKLDGFYGGDRVTLGLPKVQLNLMKKLKDTGKPLVLVLLNGSALAVNWENENIPAILEAWYPGQAAGTAIADILFGDYNPAGRLPVTFYKSEKDLPPFENYNMTGRTYKYFEKEPLYGFGYGLSYSEFKYSGLETPEKIKASDDLSLSVNIQNNSTFDGEEVVQVYVSYQNKNEGFPIRSLVSFERVKINAGETKTIKMVVPNQYLSLVTEDGVSKVLPGDYTLYVGGTQPEKSEKINVAGTTFAIMPD